MLNTVVVPLDGSALAERALPYAESLVAGGNGRLVLVRAALAATLPGGDPTNAQFRAVEEAEQYLQPLAARLAARGVQASAAVPYGRPAETIVEEVAIRSADLIVMATHGRSGLGRWVYGSVAEEVLRRSTVPVLLVRAWRETGPGAGFVRPKRILVPLDGSEFAEAALPVARELAARLPAQITLTEALLPPHVEPLERDQVLVPVDRALGTALATAENYLRGIGRGLERDLPGCEVGVDVRIGSASDSIAAASREQDGTLVVMATHGRTGLNRVLLGSVALAVLHQGEVPLLLIRPRSLPAVPTVLAAAADERTATPGPSLAVSLTGDDLELVRAGLQTLDQSLTRREHLHARIAELLRRLPRAQEPLATRR